MEDVHRRVDGTYMCGYYRLMTGNSREQSSAKSVGGIRVSCGVVHAIEWAHGHTHIHSSTDRHTHILQ
jgi:hypothetical protein